MPPAQIRHHPCNPWQIPLPLRHACDPEERRFFVMQFPCKVEHFFSLVTHHEWQWLVSFLSTRKNVNPSRWRRKPQGPEYTISNSKEQNRKTKSNRKRIRLTETQPLTQIHSDFLGNHTCLIYFYTMLYLYQKCFYWVNYEEGGSNRYRFSICIKQDKRLLSLR